MLYFTTRDLLLVQQLDRSAFAYSKPLKRFKVSEFAFDTGLKELREKRRYHLLQRLCENADTTGLSRVVLQL